MRILFLSAWFPYPPDNGSRIRVYNLIKALSQRHDVFLVSALQDDSKTEDAAHLEEMCSIVSLHKTRWFKPGTLKSMLGFFSPRPRSFVDTYDPVIGSAVKNAIEDITPDVVIASSLGMVEYIPQRLNIPTILDEHNCEYAILKRSADMITNPLAQFRRSLGWKKFARWECRICRKFTTVVMVSDKDKELLTQAAPDINNIAVVPNGVDTDYYSPDSWNPEQGTLLYNGALTYGANSDAVRYFASDIYPILSRKYSQAKLQVTGRTNGVDLTGIADCPGVKLTGYVDDIRNVLKSSAVCVVPLREGGGSRLKILEAMAAGIPVVSTTMGAEGIDAVDGKHIILADTPSYFAAAISRILSDTDLACALSRNARKLVEQHYSWSTLGESFVKVVEDIVLNSQL